MNLLAWFTNLIICELHIYYGTPFIFFFLRKYSELLMYFELGEYAGVISTGVLKLMKTNNNSVLYAFLKPYII